MNTTTMLGCALALATASCTYNYETVYEADDTAKHAVVVTGATTMINLAARAT